MVDLYSEQGGFIARGIYNQRSHVRVRLYTWDQNETPGCTLLATASGHCHWLATTTGADGSGIPPLRLVFSEADGIERHGARSIRDSRCPASQLTGRGDSVADAGADDCSSCRKRLSDYGAAAKEAWPKSKEWKCRLNVRGVSVPEGPVQFLENGIRYVVDLAVGQKTGFYLDQRENRRAAASYMRDRRVLDLFCYSGGFSLAASLQGEAPAEVLGIDSSEVCHPMGPSERGTQRRHNVQFQQRECFEVLDEFRVAGRGSLMRGGTRPTQICAESFPCGRGLLLVYHRINRVAVDLLEAGRHPRDL